MYDLSVFFVKPLRKVGALRNSNVLVFVHLFVRLFVCRQRVLIGHWPDWPRSAILLAVVSGRSAAGPVMLVLDVLMAVGAYRVGLFDCADLYKLEISRDESRNPLYLWRLVHPTPVTSARVFFGGKGAQIHFAPYNRWFACACVITL